MGAARRYEELIVWQLAVALRDRILDLTRAGPAARDWKFHSQIRDAVASPPRNLAEGFGHFDPREFMASIPARLQRPGSHWLGRRDR
jgi:23S rRNA-intervening sequence protein